VAVIVCVLAPIIALIKNPPHVSFVLQFIFHHVMHMHYTAHVHKAAYRVTQLYDHVNFQQCIHKTREKYLLRGDRTINHSSEKGV